MRDFAGKPRGQIHFGVYSIQLLKILIERPYLLHILHTAKIFYSLIILTVLSVYWSITKNEPIMQQDDGKKINLLFSMLSISLLLNFPSQMDLLGSQKVVRHFDNYTVYTHVFNEPLCSSDKYYKMCQSSLEAFS